MLLLIYKPLQHRMQTLPEHIYTQYIYIYIHIYIHLRTAGLTSYFVTIPLHMMGLLL